MNPCQTSVAKIWIALVLAVVRHIMRNPASEASTAPPVSTAQLVQAYVPATTFLIQVFQIVVPMQPLQELGPYSFSTHSPQARLDKRVHRKQEFLQVYNLWLLFFTGPRISIL